MASAESRNADMAERVRYVEGAVALLETCFLKLEEELVVELEMSVGCEAKWEVDIHQKITLSLLLVR